MFNKFINGIRKVTRFLFSAVIIGITGIFNISVFAADPPASGGGMEFFSSAIDVLQTLVIALGAGLAVWGVNQPSRRLRQR